jgi:hypothetical protein
MNAEISRTGQSTHFSIMVTPYEKMQAGRIAAHLGTDAPNVLKHMLSPQTGPGS